MAPRKKAKALPRPEPEMFTVCGDIVQETEDAILLVCDGEDVWLPKSQIEYVGERGDMNVEVTLPDWLADDNGLVDGQGVKAGESGGQQEQPQETEPEPDPDPNDTMAITLTILAFSEDGETATVEDRHANKADIPTASFTHGEDEINVGDTVLCNVLVSAVEPTDLCPDDVPNDDACASADNPEDEQKDCEALPACLRGRDVHWLKKETCTKAFPLSDEDKLELGSKMAAAQAKIDQLEDELASVRKSYKGRIEEHQETLSQAAEEFRYGKTEPQDVECDVFQDFDSGEIVYVTADDAAEVIMRRPMTTDERRPTLFDGPPSIGKGHSAPLGEDPRHRVVTTEATPQTWGHTCVDCAHMPNADDGTQAEECANCAQSVEGGTDNWAPRRECATCNYKSIAVNMPPCNTCVLNPQADAGAEDDNWISAGNKAVVEPSEIDESPAEELQAGEPVDEEAAEQPPLIGGEHQPASGAAIQ
ncbi:hypothetical protein [Desulfovibrio sp.]|uniref:hypothetical protein n=1 Tax=Desulfovibrio sp. TaxID=885 RepID=UPI0025C6DD4B|nr:hypothetical protein [Desulfovibrio sp.]